MAISLVVPAAAAPRLSDISNSWAKSYIEKGVKTGYISGYPDGSFRPENTVTRGAFCKIVNQALGLTNTAPISFTDVKPTDTFYKEIQKGVYAGYISGYEDNTFRANQTITRQQAAAMLSRILPEPGTRKPLSGLKDGGSVASYAQDGMTVVYSKGYLTPDSRGNIFPGGAMTRAQTAVSVGKLIDSEKIVRTNVDFTTAGKTYSDNMYVGNLTVNTPSNATLGFSNCRILGSMDVQGDSLVNLSNTDVLALRTSAPNSATITASGTSDIKAAVLSSGTTLAESGLSGTGFNAVTLTGTALRGRTVNLQGAFPTVTVNSPSNLNLQSGSISTLQVASGAYGSNFALAAGATVATANINDTCAFTGNGVITNAVQNVQNVTYQTQPTTVSGTYGASLLTPTVTPSNGATNVSRKPEIKLVFKEQMLRADNGALSASYIQNSVMELRRASATGTKVGFSASISSDRRTIAITPDGTLDSNTTYHLILKENSLRNASGVQNARQTYYFTTSTVSLEATPWPANNATNVSTTVSPTLTFSSDVYRSNGNSLNSSYLQNSVLELRRDSESGTSLSFSASISSNYRTITITPSNALDGGTKYYLILREGSLYGNGTTNSRQVFTFTTTGTSFSATLNATANVALNARPLLTFSSAVYDAGYSNYRAPASSTLNNAFRLYRNSTSGSQVSASFSIDSNNRVITITPNSNLEANTTYVLVLNPGYLKNGSGTTNSYQTYSFKTVSSTTPTVSITSGTSNLTPTGTIILQFSETLYNSNGGTLNNNYAANYIRLYSSNGQTGFSTVVSGNTIRITPTSAMAAGSGYIAINANAFKNSGNVYLPATNLSFTVKTTVTPEIKNLSIPSITQNSATVYFTPNVTGQARVYLTGGGSPTQTISVTANTTASAVFNSLAAGTTYRVWVVLTPSGGSSSGQLGGNSFTTLQATPTATLSLSPSSVTDSSAVIRVSSTNYKGTFAFSCSNSGAVSANPTQSGPFDVNVSNLSPSTSYTVTVSFTPTGGNTVTQTVTFNTSKVLSNDASLASVVINIDGTPYYPTGSDFNITSDKNTVTVTATSTDPNATVSIGGSSGKQVCTANVSGDFTINVTAEDTTTRNSFPYRLTITPPTEPDPVTPPPNPDEGNQPDPATEGTI